MTAPRFYCDRIPMAEETATLDRDESHHLAKVLRLEDGDAIDLVDGRGTWARAVVLDADAKAATLRVIERTAVASPHRVVVAFGVTKGAALDFIVHRLTELGVHAMVPLLTDHSLAPKEWNEERWARVLRETAKQCQETTFPLLHAPIPLEAFLRTLPTGAFAVCDEADRTAENATLPPVVLVGPEGGWSAAERERFRAAGAVFLGLGRNRLRAETAAVVAATLLKRSAGEL